MRKAGRLAAEILDELADLRRAGRHHRRARRCVREMTLDGGAVPATLGYRGYTHRCCISINHVVCHGIPARQGAEGRRHRQYRRHPAARRLARRHQPHVPRRRRAAQGEAAGRSDLRMPDDRHRRRRSPARGWAISARRSRPMPKATATAWCANSAATASAACSTTRPKWSTPRRRGTGPELKPGMFMTIEPMINLGKPACEDAQRRLDRGDPRQEPVARSSNIPSASPRTAARSSRKSPKGLDKPPY